MTSVTTLVSHAKWDEDRTLTATPRVTPAHVLFNAPSIDGTIRTEFLMTYLPDGNAEYVFTDIVEAKDFLGHQGSFIAQGSGTFKGESFTVKATFDIVKGSGTGALEHIKGKGEIDSAKEDPHKVTYKFLVEGI